MLKNIISLIWVVCACLCLSSAVHAEPHEKNGFDIVEANKQFDQVRKKLESDQWKDGKLYAAIQAILAKKNKAMTCAENGKAQIERIDALLSDKSYGSAIKTSSSDYQFLKEERTEIATRAAACRVFVFKIDKLLAEYAEKLRTQAPDETVSDVQPVWGALGDELITEFSVSTERLYQVVGLKKLTNNVLAGLVALAFVSLFIAWSLRKYCSLIIRSSGLHKVVTIHLAKVTKRYILLLLPFGLISAGLHIALFQYDPVPVIVHVCYATFFYVLSVAISQFILYFPAKKLVDNVGNRSKKIIFSRMIVVVTLIYLGYLAAVFLRGQALTQEFVDVTRALYLSLLSLGLLALSWSFIGLTIFSGEDYAALRRFMKSIVIVAFVALITAEWMGYHYLSVFAIKGILLSALLALLFWGLVLIIERLFTVIEDSNFYFARIVRNVAGIKSHHTVIEIYIFRVAIYALLLFGLFLVLMRIWGATLFQVDLIKSSAVNGFPLLGIEIVPLQILAGMLVFAVVNMLGRIYAAGVARKDQLNSQRDSQVAISSVIIYVSFTIALLAGLLVAGLNFTGLAIIAGALSVGIGFGLQNIVNNFLSGLILLIQKPVKVGDRVVVEGTEGFIRKIRVLNTQIKTLSKEDVIIPNSSLISNPVINYMFRDTFWRVTCKVGVMYGSDTDLVTKVLHEVASVHPDVLQEEPNKPVVLFKEFGDSALLFELWVIIRDVNRKYYIESQLNYAIDQEFRKHNIVIAFPQRDLHIKEVVTLTKAGD